MAKFYISAEILKARDACGHQARLFRKVFGSKPVPITEEVVAKALRAGLNVRWPALRLGYIGTAHLLSHKQSRDARAAYDRLFEIEGSGNPGDHAAEATLLLERVAAIWQSIKRKEG